MLAGVVALTLVTTAIALAGPVGIAQGFEDDDGNLVNDAAVAGIDWNSFAPVTWLPAPSTTPNRSAEKTALGFLFKGLEDWSASTADSGFAGGTKQDDNCASVITAKAPNKDDMKRVYLSTTVVGGNTFLNLAWVRIPQNTTSASAHVAFEFNKGTTSCGTGSPLVQRTAGDMLIVYDFEGGGGDPVLTLRRWVTSGACEVSSNSAPCWGLATNLTAGGFAEAKVNVTATVLDELTPPALSSTTGTSVSSTLGLSEFGEAGINLTAAGVFDANTCESFGKVQAISRSSGNSGTAQMKDLVGPGDFRLANCGTVIIRKQTDPDGDTTTDFGYTTTNITTSPATTTSPFTLKDDGVKTIINVLPGSSKTVTEDDPTSLSYALTSIDCSASTVPAANRSTSVGTRTVTFSIAAGETLDCTFTNTLQRGALKILKNSTKGGSVLTAGAIFSVDGPDVDTTADFSVTDDETAAAPDEDASIGEVCVSGLTPGSYTVNETTPPTGYGGASQTNQPVTVVAGTNCTDNEPTGTAVATFTNPPLFDIQVRFRDGGSGETSVDTPPGIDCDNPTGTDSTTDTANWDDTFTSTGVQVPAAGTITITCTFTVDP
jgi:hypothetical protein